jgi:dolichyl-phosphate-mannose--protein O-mannosyl transferase
MRGYPGPVPLLSRLNRPVVAVIAVTALAGCLRFFHLQHPPDFVFDEVYYPKAACILVGWSDQVCRVDSNDEKYWRAQKWDVGSWVHPPLGKWEIALGIKAFGMDPWGWRFTSALAGTLVVLFTAMIAQLLFGKPVWTFVAGLLIATEHLNVVMSRTALLDIHLELWVVVGFFFLLLDRRWLERRQQAETEIVVAAETLTGEEAVSSPPPPPSFSPVLRPWRLAAGAAFGAAASVKWSGAMALFAAVIIVLMWETARRHRGDRSWARALGRAIARESLGIVIAFLFIPVAIYMLTWLPWLHHFGWNMGAWWKNQVDSARFHRSGIDWTALDPKTGQYTPTHPYYARAWKWIPDLRPTSFFVLNGENKLDIEQVLAIGNPIIFWASVVVIPWVGLMWYRLRDWRAGFIFVAFAGQYLPWFLVTRPTFFFYVLPLTPFMVLAITYVCRQASDATIVVRDRETRDVAINPETGEPAISHAYVYRPFVVAYVIAAVAVFIWFWPVLTAGRISLLHWHTIVWFNAWI